MTVGNKTRDDAVREAGDVLAEISQIKHGPAAPGFAVNVAHAKYVCSLLGASPELVLCECERMLLDLMDLAEQEPQGEAIAIAYREIQRQKVRLGL